MCNELSKLSDFPIYYSAWEMYAKCKDVSMVFVGQFIHSTFSDFLECREIAIMSSVLLAAMSKSTLGS